MTTITELKKDRLTLQNDIAALCMAFVTKHKGVEIEEVRIHPVTVSYNPDDTAVYRFDVFVKPVVY